MNVKITQIKDEDRTLSELVKMLGKGTVYYAYWSSNSNDIVGGFSNIFCKELRDIQEILENEKYIIFLIEEEKQNENQSNTN